NMGFLLDPKGRPDRQDRSEIPIWWVVPDRNKRPGLVGELGPKFSGCVCLFSAALGFLALASLGFFLFLPCSALLGNRSQRRCPCFVGILLGVVAPVRQVVEG